MAQNPHVRSQPSAIFTYAHGAGPGAGQVEQVELGHGGRLLLAGVAAERSDRTYRHAEAADSVHLGQRRGQLAAVALGHAAGDDEARPVPPALVQGQDRVDRLLPGVLDEGAGVDDDEVGGGGSSAASRPSASSVPTSLSESTWFLGQPSVSM